MCNLFKSDHKIEVIEVCGNPIRKKIGYGYKRKWWFCKFL